MSEHLCSLSIVGDECNEPAIESVEASNTQGDTIRVWFCAKHWDMRIRAAKAAVLRAFRNGD